MENVFQSSPFVALMAQPGGMRENAMPARCFHTGGGCCGRGQPPGPPSVAQAVCAVGAFWAGGGVWMTGSG